MWLDHILDKERAREKMNVHHSGDPRYLVDIVRHGMILEEVEHYNLVYDRVHTDESWDVVEVLDRFKVPAENGYRDLKIRVRLKENGHIATLRFVFSALLKSQFDAMPLDEKVAKIEVVTKPVASPAYVITFDNFNYQEPEARTLISGFPDTKSSQTYAAMRIKDNLSRIEGDTPKEKLDRWLLFGESVTMGTIHGDELPEAPGAAQSAITYLNDPPDADLQDWFAFGEQLDLKAQALPFSTNKPLPPSNPGQD